MTSSQRNMESVKCAAPAYQHTTTNGQKFDTKATKCCVTSSSISAITIWLSCVPFGERKDIKMCGDFARHSSRSASFSRPSEPRFHLLTAKCPLSLLLNDSSVGFAWYNMHYSPPIVNLITLFSIRLLERTLSWTRNENCTGRNDLTYFVGRYIWSCNVMPFLNCWVKLGITGPFIRGKIRRGFLQFQESCPRLVQPRVAAPSGKHAGAQASRLLLPDKAFGQRALPAPQLREHAAERPVWHSDSRRLHVRRAVRSGALAN